MNLTDNSRASVPLPFIIGFALFIVIGGYAMGVVFTPLLFPPQASAEAKQVDELFKILLIIGGAIFLLVQGLLLYSVIRFRAEPGDMSDGPPIHGNTTLELVWTAIPSVIVLVLVVLSYQVWVDIRAERTGENLVNGQVVPVSSTGQRFAWAFSYQTPVTNPADDSGVTLRSNILYTYVGQRMRIKMDAVDVIHAFWIPAMRVKQDLMPGRTTEIQFTSIEPEGVAFNSENYIDLPIVCAELCGSGHGQMRAVLRLYKDEASYVAAFYEPGIDVILNPPADPVLRGEQLLASGAYPCSNCHAMTVLGWDGNQAPTLDGIGDRAVTRIQGYSAEEYLSESFYDPHAYLVPGYGPLMPAFQSDDPNGLNYMPATDRAAIVAYLCAQTDGGEPTCIIDPAEIGVTAADTEPEDAETEVEVEAEATAEATAAP